MGYRDLRASVPHLIWIMNGADGLQKGHSLVFKGADGILVRVLRAHLSNLIRIVKRVYRIEKGHSF